MVEKATNEKIGPLTSFNDINQLMAMASKQKRKSHFWVMMAQVREVISEADHNRSLSYEVAYSDAESIYPDHKQRKKRSRSEAILRKLRNILSEIVLNEGIITEILEGTWDSGTYRFSKWPSRLILEPLQSSFPTNSFIQRAAGSVLRIYISIKIYVGNQGLNLLSSTLLDTNASDYHKAFAQYILGKCTSEDLTKKFLCRNNSMYFEEFLQNRYAPDSTTQLELLILFLIASNHDLRNIFVGSVAKNAKEATLAKKLWRSLASGSIFKFGNDYNHCKKIFDVVIALIKAYKAHPATATWLQDQTSAPNPDQTFSRMDAFDTLYDNVTRCSKLLYMSDFKTLLELHKDMFNNPTNYGYNSRP